ncbi:alpha/beta hydrolase [Lentibacillus saliphilus]|uniref:alpha/beta hydrolase n=1 Tax=Lentibacillus saliphilus TaxID=2737028 RepID=UPI001C2F5F4D|nr:alpha/beta hydrolase-fold protein [Lentibacillus saliphilus]
MTMTNHTIYSSELDRHYTYKILKSDRHTHKGTMDVLYVQDGEDYLALGDIETTYAQLMKRYPKVATQLVFVLIHPGDSMERWHAYHRDGQDFKRYIQFMNDTFVPTVEHELLDSGRAEIGKRGLLGDSLAGNISLNIAMTNPKRWTHLLLQSAAVTEREVDQLAKCKSINWNVYQTVGIYEDDFVSPITHDQLYILSRNRQLHDAFSAKQVNVTYVEQQESHLWTFWKKDLMTALEHFVV